MTAAPLRCGSYRCVGQGGNQATWWKLSAGAFGQVNKSLCPRKPVYFGFPRDDTGIWGSYVVDASISGQFGWLAQLGLDIGDDSGLLVGAGLKYAINEKTDLRTEYIVRDEVDSLQFNFLFHL